MGLQRSPDFYFFPEAESHITMNREEPRVVPWQDTLRRLSPTHLAPDVLEQNISLFEGHPQLVELLPLEVDGLGPITLACWINNGDKRVRTRSGHVLGPRSTHILKTFFLPHFQPQLNPLSARGQGFFCFACHKFVKATDRLNNIEDFEDQLLRHVNGGKCLLDRVTPHQGDKARLKTAIDVRFKAQRSQNTREHLEVVHAHLADGQQQMNNIVGTLRAEISAEFNNLNGRVGDLADTVTLANEQLNNKIQRTTVQMKECAWCSAECDEKLMSHCDLGVSARDEQHFFCNRCFGPWVRNPTNHARLVVYCQTCKHGGGVEAVIIPHSDVSEGFFARKRELEEAANHERERDLANAKSPEETLKEQLAKCHVNMCQNPLCRFQMEWDGACAKLICRRCQLPQCAACGWNNCYTATGMKKHRNGVNDSNAVYDHILQEHQAGAEEQLDPRLPMANVNLKADYIREQNVKINKERAMKVFSEKGNREPFALLDQMRLLHE